ILCQTSSLKWQTLSAQALRHRDRSRVTHISLTGPLIDWRESTFGQLVRHVFTAYGILCFGVYRLDHHYNTRYVLTNPSQDFPLEPNDLVFALIQCDTKI
ncbi:unnamed protein product, partial [Medioppia subpectinata]